MGSKKKKSKAKATTGSRFWATSPEHVEHLVRNGKVAPTEVDKSTATEIKEDEVYLLLVGTIVVPEVTAIVGEAEKVFGREINYTVMTEDELAFRKKNNDPFIWRFLKQPKIMLVGTEEDLLK